MYEQSVDRLACALGGKVVLPPAFQVSLFSSRVVWWLVVLDFREWCMGKVVLGHRRPWFLFSWGSCASTARLRFDAYASFFYTKVVEPCQVFGWVALLLLLSDSTSCVSRVLSQGARPP